MTIHFELLQRNLNDSSFTVIEFSTRILGKYKYWLVWRRSPGGSDYALTLFGKAIKRFG